MQSAARAAFAVAIALAAATAQERRTTPGIVRDAAGEPAAGAAVRLCYVPTGATGRPAYDVVDATSDDRGRFRAALLPCARYRAFAIGAADASGARHVSAVSWADATGIVELHLEHAQAPRRLALTGLDPWRDDGPFAVRWLVDGIDAGAAPTAVEDDAIDVPPLPAGRCGGELLDRDGQPFFVFTLDTRKNREVVAVDPPQIVPLRAVDADGAPVAGVEFRQRIRSHWSPGDALGPYPLARLLWRRLGVADADGRLAARVAARQDPMTDTGWQSLTFAAVKDGLETAFAGFRRNPFADSKEFAREPLAELPLVLRPAAPLRGRVVRGAAPCAGVGVAVAGHLRIDQLEGNGTTFDEIVFETRTDADGRFEVSGVTGELHGIRVLLQPDAAVPAAGDGEATPHLPPQPYGLHPAAIARDREAVFDLGATVLVRLQLLDATGGPARGARVLFLSLTDDPACDWATPQAVPDRGGRLAMRLQPGRWFVFARDATAMAHAELDVTADAERTLKLEPMPAMRGVVVDGDGNPIAGAELDCHGSTWQSNNQPRPLEPIAEALNWRWIDGVRTDAEGRFVCAFLDLPNTSYEARFTKGGKRSNDFQVRAGDEPETIVIR